MSRRNITPTINSGVAVSIDVSLAKSLQRLMLLAFDYSSAGVRNRVFITIVPKTAAAPVVIQIGVTEGGVVTRCAAFVGGAYTPERQSGAPPALVITEDVASLTISAPLPDVLWDQDITISIDAEAGVLLGDTISNVRLQMEDV